MSYDYLERGRAADEIQTGRNYSMKLPKRAFVLVVCLFCLTCLFLFTILWFRSQSAPNPIIVTNQVISFTSLNLASLMPIFTSGTSVPCALTPPGRETVPPVSSALLIEKNDIREYVEHNRKQSMERFRLNTFAPTLPVLFFAYLPQIQCTTMVRVGGLADGGYWLCNPWRIRHQPEPCLVYSLGLLVDLQFDVEMVEKYACQTYVLSPKAVQQISNKSLHLYPWAAVSSTTDLIHPTQPIRKSIADVLHHFKHTRLDILKVDMEGAELDLVENFLKNDTPLVPVCQISIEMHPWRLKEPEKWQNIFRRLERAGFLMFSREVNVLLSTQPHPPIKYAYIHEDCLDKFGLDKSITFTNFPPKGCNFVAPPTPHVR